MRCVDSPADHVSGRLTQLAAFDRGCAKQRGHFRVVSSSISLTVNFNCRPNPKTFQNAPYIGCDDIKKVSSSYSYCDFAGNFDRRDLCQSPRFRVRQAIDHVRTDQ